MWIYIETEHNLWTVGYYDPAGKFVTDSDHESRDGARARVAYLNGRNHYVESSNDVIDRKFKILAVNPCKAGKVYTEHDGMFFTAKDAALPAALKAYREQCVELGCGNEHIESIDLLINRVDAYQRKERKVPDTETDCELDRCIGGIGV